MENDRPKLKTVPKAEAKKINFDTRLAVTEINLKITKEKVEKLSEKIRILKEQEKHTSTHKKREQLNQKIEKLLIKLRPLYKEYDKLKNETKSLNSKKKSKPLSSTDFFHNNNHVVDLTDEGPASKKRKLDDSQKDSRMSISNLTN